MKKIIFFITLFLIQNQTFGQKDSVYVITTYENITENNISTGVKRVVEQKSYKKKNNRFFVLREVKYDEKSEPVKYIYYFYNVQDSILQIQFYNKKDELTNYLTHEYKKNNRIAVRSYSNKNLLIHEEKYKKNKKETIIITNYSSNKIISIKRQKYQNDKIIEEEITWNEEDTLKKQITNFTYQQGLLVNKTTQNFYDSSVDTLIEKYHYNDLRKKEKIEFISNNSILLYSDNYFYNADGSLRRIIRRNKDDKRLSLYYYDYKKYYREIPEKELILD